MTRVVRPTGYLTNRYYLVCPDCDRVRWGSGRCPGCGAQLVGPWRRSTWVDTTVRTWVIADDGTAQRVIV